MKAVIEIGTNSLKVLIYRSKDTFQVVYDKTSITRLGEGFHKSGKISQEALKRNIEEINKAKEICQHYNCQQISVFGTMIFRSASNTEEVIASIYKNCNLQVRVLTGQEEAKYSFLAASYSLPVKDKKILVIDTGGGSTEFITGKNNEISLAKSLNIGAVTLTDLFSLINKVAHKTIIKSQDYLREELASVITMPKPDVIVGIGGTVTTISAIVQKLETYSAQRVQGSRVEKYQITDLITELASKNMQERQRIIGLSAKRADIILGGVLIINSILDRFNSSELLVCDNGLRYGLALKEWRKI